MNKIIKYTISITVCLLVGYFSGKITSESITTWYPTIIKPFFNPPNFVFRPVWTTLYIFMGIAAARIWSNEKSIEALQNKALLFFVIQLCLNALWSYLFFGLQNIFLAWIEMALLLLFIYETYLIFKKIDKFSGYLFIPYLAWVSFAFILNGSIWWLNR